MTATYREAESPRDDEARVGEDTAGYMELDGAEIAAPISLLVALAGI